MGAEAGATELGAETLLHVSWSSQIGSPLELQELEWDQIYVGSKGDVLWRKAAAENPASSSRKSFFSTPFF